MDPFGCQSMDCHRYTVPPIQSPQHRQQIRICYPKLPHLRGWWPKCLFLDADTQLSVRLSVHPSFFQQNGKVREILDDFCVCVWGGGDEVWMRVRCPCPPVRYDIGTPVTCCLGLSPFCLPNWMTCNKMSPTIVFPVIWPRFHHYKKLSLSPQT